MVQYSSYLLVTKGPDTRVRGELLQSLNTHQRESNARKSSENYRIPDLWKSSENCRTPNLWKSSEFEADLPCILQVMSIQSFYRIFELLYASVCFTLSNHSIYKLRHIQPTAEVTRIPVYEDNQGAIKLTENPLSSARTRHTDIRHHFVRTLSADGDIVVYVTSNEQHADVLTKPPEEESFVYAIVMR